MPRSRRRHHSRSRSRSRSHSHERDREAKRRKIESVESPTHKRSVSEPENEDHNEEIQSMQQQMEVGEKQQTIITPKKQTQSQDHDEKQKSSKLDEVKEETIITPKKTLSPKQLQKKLESDKKKQQKQQEREEREKEKEKLRQEKLKEKQLKEEQRQKEKQEKEEQRLKEKQEKEEQRLKEKQEKEEQRLKEKQDKEKQKEQKRKEREEKEEQRRKEKEQEKLKQQEIEEKNKKIEEQKQKTAAAFKSFFRKSETTGGDKRIAVKNLAFMPFQKKSDMRLPPSRRPQLTDKENENLLKFLTNQQEVSYLKELKDGKSIGSSPRTWPYEDPSDDVIVVEDEEVVGETIGEDKPKMKMRAKFLSFHDNQRPPYYGTFRKKSKSVKGRRPFVEDKEVFDYEVDSGDDWEEEEQGESLKGSDDEEKEEEDDYEVDNEFFVPHGHLSDDEVDDEANAKMSPESHKAKLKLLKAEFDEDMQHKTHKLKARSIGCIWYNKDGTNVDVAIDRYLKPLSIVTNGQIVIKKRCNLPLSTVKAKLYKDELDAELIPKFLKLIHGNTSNRKAIVSEFVTTLMNNGWNISKACLSRFLKTNAQWKKCEEAGPLLNKFCWCVNDNVKEKLTA